MSWRSVKGEAILSAAPPWWTVNWSFAPTVTRRGIHVLTVEARDRAGNVTAFGPHVLNVTGYTIYLPVVRRNFP